MEDQVSILVTIAAQPSRGTGSSASDSTRSVPSSASSPVGDIIDETDVTVTGVVPQRDGSYLVDGSVTLRDLNREFEWDLPDEDASTIAGLIMAESRSIPAPGQVFGFHGFRFEILRRQLNQIVQLRVTPPRSDDEVLAEPRESEVETPPSQTST